MEGPARPRPKWEVPPIRARHVFSNLTSMQPVNRTADPVENKQMATALSTTEETLAAIDAFNEAFNTHDVAAIMALMTDDVVFENTSPFPDGERHVGQAAVGAFWTNLFAATPSAFFEAEEAFAAGDRATVRWRYSWVNADGAPGHIRGVDVFRVRDGKVAEKLSYVKG